MSDSLHDKRFPGESDAYRSARNELRRAELDLRQNLEEVAALRRKLPRGGNVKEDYVFEEMSDSSTVSRVKLSELFATDKTSLILYSFMYGPDAERACPLCNVFTKADDGIYHFWASEMLFAPLDGHARHIDLLWPLWNFLDLTPEGRGTDWLPQLEYS